MSTSGKPGPDRVAFDPQRMEAAGRSVRVWLDTFRTRIAKSQRPIIPLREDIAWEDGEPENKDGGRRIM